MLLGHSPHQGGLLAVRLCSIYVSAISKELRDNSYSSGPRSTHEWRFAHTEPHIWIRTRVEQQLDHLCATSTGRQPKWCRAQFIGNRNCRTGFNQCAGSVDVVTMRSPMKRGSPIALRCIRISPRIQQLHQPRKIALSHNIDNLTIRLAICDSSPKAKT